MALLGFVLLLLFSQLTGFGGRQSLARLFHVLEHLNLSQSFLGLALGEIAFGQRLTFLGGNLVTFTGFIDHLAPRRVRVLL